MLFTYGLPLYVTSSVFGTYKILLNFECTFESPLNFEKKAGIAHLFWGAENPSMLARDYRIPEPLHFVDCVITPSIVLCH
jgi:hypothetical protein